MPSPVSTVRSSGPNTSLTIVTTPSRIDTRDEHAQNLTCRSHIQKEALTDSSWATIGYMRWPPVLMLGVCVATLSGCGRSCADTASESGVGLSYTGFAQGASLTARVCIKDACYVSASTKVDPGVWVSAGIYPDVLKGVKVISVTVRDAKNQVVARDDSVEVNHLDVGDSCTSLTYDAALQVSPHHIAAATHA